MLRYTGAVLFHIMAFPILAGGKTVSMMAINVGGLNVRFVELLALAMAGVYAYPARMPRVRRSTQFLFLAILAVMVTGVVVGVTQSANITDALNDARAFGSVLLYYPLRRVIITCRNEDRLLDRAVLGMVGMVVITAILFFGFPSYVTFLNEGGLGGRYPRLSVINSFAETLFLSAVVVIAMFYRHRMANSWKAALLVVVSVAVYVYGFRSILLICLFQIPLAAIIALIERRSSPARPLKWAIGILLAGLVVSSTVGISLRDDQIERLESLYSIATGGLGSAEPTESVFTRLTTFERLYDEVRDRPLLGRGFGYIAPVYGYSGEVAQESLVIDSLYVYLLVKTGVLGLGVFVLLMSTLLVRGFHLVVRAGGFWNRVFLLFGISVVLSGITESAIIRSNAGWILLVLWAVLLEKNAGTTSERTPTGALHGRKVGAPGAAALSVVGTDPLAGGP